jgi:hypothetical protein
MTESPFGQDPSSHHPCPDRSGAGFGGRARSIVFNGHSQMVEPGTAIHMYTDTYLPSMLGQTQTEILNSLRVSMLE